MTTFKSLRVLVVALAATLLYVTLRYPVFKGVPWTDYPAYVVNKALAWTAVWLFLAAALAGRRGRAHPGPSPATYLHQAFGLVVAHVILSLALMGETYYASMFAGAKLTLTASFSVLAGSLATVAAVRVVQGGAEGRRAHGLLVLLCALTTAHLGAKGGAKWFDVAGWPGGLPPVTLLSSLVSLSAGLVALRTALKGTAAD